MTAQNPCPVAFIGSYVPRRCGIATFTHHLASAVSQAVHNEPLSEDGNVSIVAMTDRAGEYSYRPEVRVEINQYRREDYRNAAEILNTSRIGVVSLQHEYGLYAGEAGAYLFELLDRLRKPLVSTLHTVLSNPSPQQREAMQWICRRSSAVVVMAERAKTILKDVYDVPSDRLRLIYHGVPDVPFGDTEPFKQRLGLGGRTMILTFGLLGPGKAIEVMLEALGQVVSDHPDVVYVILGATHPGVRRESGEQYRLSLERRAAELGIHNNVLFHNRYVSDKDLREYLQAADIYATPYRGKEQITSGTLAYAVAAGQAIVSTPYWHAQELLSGGRGRLASFDDANDFADALRVLLGNPEERMRMRKAAYDFGRAMIWPTVAKCYGEVFEEAKETFSSMAGELIAKRKGLLRVSLPDVHLDHLFTMSDDTGILQHAIYMTPDRRHGYCTDDNARALVVAAMAWSLFQDERVLPKLITYLSFLHFAHMPDSGRFRNFMSYDRRWLESDGSDDCQGRALWALGYLISHPPNESTARLARDLFRSAVVGVSSLEWPRAWALSILGLHYYLRAEPDDAAARDMLAGLAARLESRFAKHASDDWPWFEDIVTYDNARIPQAFIIAGVDLEKEEYVKRGISVLEWLVAAQTAEDGHLSVIGMEGWYKKNGSRAKYDQQPLEPAALIGACKAAYRASGARNWLVVMRRCFEWYIGKNDNAQSMVDFRSFGCYDGLEKDGVNQNQGAESVLSWLLSLLIMHEMQTGDALEIG